MQPRSRLRLLPPALSCCLIAALIGGCGQKQADTPQYDRQHFGGSPASLTDAQLNTIPEPYRDIARRQRDAALKRQGQMPAPPSAQ